MKNKTRYCKYCGGIITNKRKKYYCSKLCSCSNNILTKWRYTRYFIWIRDNKRCRICKRLLSLKKRYNKYPVLEVHHDNPKCKGGSNEPSNLISCCPNCHKILTKELHSKDIDLIIEELISLYHD